MSSQENKTLKEECIKSLSAALCVCPPDEYQQRHNLLIRQLAAFILHEDIMEGEGEVE